MHNSPTMVEQLHAPEQSDINKWNIVNHVYVDPVIGYF